MSASQHESSKVADGGAKLMLVILCLAWGLTWPALRVALTEIPVFSLRVVTCALGAGGLLTIAWLQGRSFALRGARDWLHVVVASMLNIVCFTMLTALALVTAATSRVAILSYAMPIWAALFAWLVLGERFNTTRLVAFALCIAGIAILIWPLWHGGIPLGILLAVVTGVSWGAGTVYLKWAQIDGDPVAVAAWQLTFAFVFVAACQPFVEGSLHLSQAHAPALLGMVFTGLVGSAFAYFLWFKVVERVPAMTASLGILSVPLVGAIATGLLLGEWPTVTDMIGFALIFAASICVLLPPREPAAPEPG